MHEEKHFTGSEMVRDVVIGMSDGLTVPFALAAGLSGAVDNNAIIVTAGVAEIIAGSIAMGLGGYLAAKTEYEHYEAELAREYEEIERVPEREIAETKEIFSGYGLPDETVDTIVAQLSKNKDRWAEFMMRYELGLEKPEVKRAAKSAFNIGTSYIIGGLVPLVAYIFTTKPSEGFMYSTITTLIALFTFGYIKSKIIGQPPMKGAFRVLVIGAIAAGVAYLTARLFS
ncbi:MAG: VIT1/CCC1 transporter family protein [Bacteroidetes bacterium]|nr:VIT1/CCC1 transporter family protein [Bacteroidota bacterium]